jgi:hypothetical protein
MIANLLYNSEAEGMATTTTISVVKPAITVTIFDQDHSSLLHQTKPTRLRSSAPHIVPARRKNRVTDAPRRKDFARCRERRRSEILAEIL